MNKFIDEFKPESADIAICGSMSSKDQLMQVIEALRSTGFTVSTPEMTKKFDWSTFTDEEIVKQKGRLVRRHFANIACTKAVLICNYDKNETPNYIGTNTLMEMTAAFAYDKPIYLLNGIPEQNGREEIIAMNPVILQGDLSKIEVSA